MIYKGKGAKMSLSQTDTCGATKTLPRKVTWWTQRPGVYASIILLTYVTEAIPRTE